MKLQSKLALCSLPLTLAFASCEKKAEFPSPPPPKSETPTPQPAADNTERNKVDRDTTTKTPLDQSNSKADIDITASIRRAIMEDKSMSINAQNCKIITENGVTTLRGPVATQAEKDAIESKAKAIAGVTRVDNQLEVKAK